jgi:SAM-dependent methyltransferase
MGHNAAMAVYEAFHGVSDEEWYRILQRSVTEPSVDGVRLPGFPAEEVQRSVVGSANEHALRDGFLLYQEIKSYAGARGIAFDRSTRLLDFGCGWGRHYRFFLKDVPPQNLLGIDCDASFIEICKQTIPMGCFRLTSPYPPAGLAEASFDIIYAYSVFSHLNEAIGLAWIEELTRALKPGGLIVVTTHARSLVEACETYRRNPELQTSAWHRTLARKGFRDVEAALASYERGDFLYAATGGGGVRTADIYGEAVLSRSYVTRMWTRELQLVDFVDDPQRLPQVLIVLRRPGS